MHQLKSEFSLYSPRVFTDASGSTLLRQIHLKIFCDLTFYFWLCKYEISARKEKSTYNVKVVNNQPVKFTNHLFKSKILSDGNQQIVSRMATLNREYLTEQSKLLT